MKNIQPQALCEEMSTNTADQLEFVRDSLQDLQANVAWMQQEARDTMKSLVLRGLVLEFEDLMGQIAVIQSVINKE